MSSNQEKRNPNLNDSRVLPIRYKKDVIQTSEPNDSHSTTYLRCGANPNSMKANYVIVGSGVAAFSALQELQKLCSINENVILIGKRVTPLMLENITKLKSNVSILKNEVVDIHLKTKVITLADGTMVSYDKCLIATGLMEQNLLDQNVSLRAVTDTDQKLFDPMISTDLRDGNHIHFSRNDDARSELIQSATNGKSILILGNTPSSYSHPSRRYQNAFLCFHSLMCMIIVPAHLIFVTIRWKQLWISGYCLSIDWFHKEPRVGIRLWLYD
jgi:hypothetical protein